ncbi:MAG: glycosyltransferase family 2 protein [Terriglobia bacterium]
MSGVSVLVLTYNEEANLPACLESVRWADDIHVVDSGSRDRTAEIARRSGAQVYVHAFENFSAQHNWALRHVRFRYDWVLALDADERTPPELAEEIRAAVAQAPPAVAGFEMRRAVGFLGRWLTHAGQFNQFWFLRLFRHRATRYEDRSVNEYPLVAGDLRRLHGWLLHENRKPVSDLLEKYNHYSTLEAAETLRLRRGSAPTALAPRWRGGPQERRRWLKHLHLRLPFRGLRKFLYLFLWRQGFRDGVPGLLFCLFMAAQEFMLSRKVGAVKRGLPVS